MFLLKLYSNENFPLPPLRTPRSRAIHQSGLLVSGSFFFLPQSVRHWECPTGHSCGLREGCQLEGEKATCLGKLLVSSGHAQAQCTFVSLVCAANHSQLYGQGAQIIPRLLWVASLIVIWCLKVKSPIDTYKIEIKNNTWLLRGINKLKHRSTYYSAYYIVPAWPTIVIIITRVQ